MNKTDYVFHKKVHWNGKILRVHITIDLIHRLRKVKKIVEAVSDPENDAGFRFRSFDQPVYFKRNYFIASTPHDVYHLPATVKTLKQAKHYIRDGLSKNILNQKAQWTAKHD